MRTNVRTFCKVCAQSFDVPEPVYEFGSFCYPEQAEFADMGQFFSGKEYVGCDTQKGRNVDRIEDLESLTLGNKSVGTAVVLETLEHVRGIQKAFTELYRVLKDGGMLIAASPFIFPIHNIPNDYWRFTPKGLAYLMKDFSVRLIGTHADPLMPHTIYGIGFKNKKRSDVAPLADRFIKSFIQESRPRKKMSYEIALKLKGIIRGKAYVDNVRKRHEVRFEYY